MLGGRGGDRAAGVGGAREADAVDIGVGDEGGPGDLADAVDDVDDAGRNSRTRGDLGRAASSVSGAHSGGLITTVLPAASAGPTFHVPSMNGAFHGTIRAATPAGS